MASTVSCVKPNASQWKTTLRDDVGFRTGYITEYTAANFWHYPIRCCVTFESALEFMMTSQRNCLTKIIHTSNCMVFFISYCLYHENIRGKTLSGKATLKSVLRPLWKGSTLKGGEQILPFRVDPFSEGTWCVGKQARSYKSCLPCKDRQKMYELNYIFSIYLKNRACCPNNHNFWSSLDEICKRQLQNDFYFHRI